MFRSVNPYTEECFLQTALFSDEKVEQALELADRTWQMSWSRQAIKNRCEVVRRLILSLEKNKKQLATFITQEMGKPLQQSEAEIKKCIHFCDFASQNAEKFLTEKQKLPMAPAGSYVVYRSLGVILGIMPWNFPVWQVCRFALPSILSGNTVLIKHAPNTMGTAKQLETIFQEADFPKGVYQNLPVSLEQTAKLIQDQRVQGVSLTGSVRAGRIVAELAGRHLKKTVLELGGSDPYLLLDSVDVESAAEECVAGRMVNNGQSCIAAKRFIVTRKNADYFTDIVIEKMRGYRTGDPSLPDTLLGPLAREELRDNLHRQVQKLNDSMKLLLGGKCLKRKGYFYPPTVLRQDKFSLTEEYKEELFGPVALIIVVSNEAEAVQAANHSNYGLGAAVFGTDRKKAERIARDELKVGSCSIGHAMHSHPALPFGGIKNSGYGRELSEWGFYEFVNIKTIQS